MSYGNDDSVQLSINVSVGIKIAADFAVAASRADGGDATAASIASDFRTILPEVIAAVLETQESAKSTGAAVEQLTETFPGTSIQPEPAGYQQGTVPPAAYQQARVPVAGYQERVVTAGPPVVPGATHKDDAKWKKYFANPSNYFDNRGDPRSSSGGGKGPDLKEKGKTGNEDALWLQYAPDWVKATLG